MQRTGGDYAIVLQGYSARDRMTCTRKGDFLCPIDLDLGFPLAVSPSIAQA